MIQTQSGLSAKNAKRATSISVLGAQAGSCGCSVADLDQGGSGEEPVLALMQKEVEAERECGRLAAHSGCIRVRGKG